MKKIILLFILITLFIYTGFSEGGNLLEDPSFENIEDIHQEFGPWHVLAFNQIPGSTEFKIETGGAHTGEKYVTIINYRENHARFIQRIGVLGGETYRLSCWVKTEDVGTETKGANITEEGISEYSPDISGTSSDWVYTEMYLRIGKGIDTIAVALSLGGYYGTNTGKASFDDITVEVVNIIPGGAVVASKGEFVEKKKEEEQPVRIIKEPGPMNIPVFIAFILALVCVLSITGRIVYINIKKRKSLKESESKKGESGQEKA